MHTPRDAIDQQSAVTPAMLDAMTDIAVHASGAILAIAHADIAAERKADGSSVTRADAAAEVTILSSLARNFPGTVIVSEEQYAASPSAIAEQAFFLVDPLDGTREFVAGSNEYTVNIALIHGGVAVAGVVAAPAQGLLWRGGTGLGAQRLGFSRGGEIERAGAEAIHARRWPASHPVAAVSRSHLDADTIALLARIGNVQQCACGSALKFCRVAEGAADIYPRLAPTCEWDIAAGHAVLTAAGGTVLRPDGTAMRYGGTLSGFGVPAFIAWGDPEAARVMCDRVS